MTHFDSMVEIDNMLKGLSLSHWVSFGTLLGIHREGGQIKGDNDIDFDCYSEDMKKKYKGIVRGLHELGYRLKCWPEEKKIKIIAKKDGVEIAIAGFRAKGKYRIRNKWRIPSKFFTIHGVIEYKDKEFKCHYPIKEYLEWVYSDWRTPMAKHLGNKLYMRKVLRKC